MASNPTLSSSAPPHPSYHVSYVPPPVPSTIAPESPVSSAPQTIKTEPSYDYSTAIDPALQAPDTTNASGPRLPRYHPAGTSVTAGQGPPQGHGIGDASNLRGGNLPSSILLASSQPLSRERTFAHTSSPATKVKVDELAAPSDAPSSSFRDSWQDHQAIQGSARPGSDLTANDDRRFPSDHLR